METKYNYTAIINGHPVIYNSGLALNCATGRGVEISLNGFRQIARKHNAEIVRRKNLLPGQYINWRTGKTECIYGMNY